jgi:CDP-glycerol glycerophosphotransferase
VPALSVLLVVHREQGHLDELLGALGAQDLDDVEVVAVDDASPDHGPELLDAFAARQPGARVEHLARRAGPGAARNAALDLARGDFVWLVRTTDLLEPGAIAAVVAALRGDGPDVLVVGHDRVDRTGRRLRGPAVPAEPDVARAGRGTWDLVLRREHLARLGARFGDGAHGELRVTWPAVLAAREVAALPAAVHVRRDPPNATRAGRPLDLFAQYDAVFAFADAHDDVAPERRRAILPAMVAQGLALLPAVPAAERPAFFAALSESYRRHRRGDEPAPAGRVARLRTRLVDRGGYAAFARVERARRTARVTRRAARDPRRTLARRWRRWRRRRAKPSALQAYYRERLREPVDPDLAVFAAYWYRPPACNPRAIHEAARRLVPGLRGVWVVKEEAAASVPEGVEYVVPGTREYFDVIARAGWFVNNVNFPNHLVKRPGTVHVMTHHGTPLKRMGLDLRATPVAGRRMNFAALMRRCARWDFSISSNIFSTLVWERVYPLPYESIESGYPRNDVLVNATPGDVRRIRDGLGIAPSQVAVLYTPTHREGALEYEAVLDVARVAEGLGDDHVLLVRTHYFYGSDPVLQELHRQGRVRDVADHPSVEELCLAADVLITDYSSIMFDYAVLDRPILIHAPDWEEYAATRGTYFDLMEEPPGAIARTEDELVDALRSGRVDDDEARRLRAAFRARFCSLEDGRAAERVVRRVWLGEREPATGTPDPVIR